jgi:hypothetical protein
MSEEEVNLLISDLRNVNGLKVDKETDKISVEFIYSLDNANFSVRNEVENEVNTILASHRKILFKRDYVFATMSLDCNITNSYILARPENWKNQCIFNPDTFEWKEIFKDNLISMINNGTIDSIGASDIQAATNLINGYDITIANFDSPEDKVCELSGWKIVNNDEERYFENGCYKLRKQQFVKQCSVGSEASLFNVAGNGSTRNIDGVFSSEYLTAEVILAVIAIIVLVSFAIYRFKRKS